MYNNAKFYYDVIHHLKTEGHKFSDMQLCIKLVAFIYEKTPEEVRKDVWEEIKTCPSVFIQKP